jgi:hypothetical protein
MVRVRNGRKGRESGFGTPEPGFESQFRPNSGRITLGQEERAPV